MDFRRSGFDRPVTDHFKEQILSQLAGAGIATLTVIIRRGPHNEPVLEFDGAEEDIARAKSWYNARHVGSGQVTDGRATARRLVHGAAAASERKGS